MQRVMADLAALSTIAILHVGLQVLILLHEAAMDDVDDYVGLAHIDQHVVFEANGGLLTYKYTIADSKVLDHVVTTIDIILNLEMATTMLLCSLLVLIRNDEVVHHVFLNNV